MVAQLVEISKIYTKHGVLFFHAPMNTMGSVRVAEFFHMTDPETVNSIRILEFREDRVFRYKMDTFDEGKLMALLDDVLAKRAVPYWKSEKPAKNHRSRATVVVGSTFDELVINSHDSVMLFVLDPENEACKNLVPETSRNNNTGWLLGISTLTPTTSTSITESLYADKRLRTITLGANRRTAAWD